MEAQERDTILAKLQRLKALTTSTNVHESALAAAKYAELLLKHNLADFEVASFDRSGDVYTGDEVHFKHGIQWKHILLHKISSNMLCYVVFQRRRAYSIIVGRPENIEAVKFVFNIVASQIGILADVSVANNKIFLHNSQEIRLWKRSFLNGALIEIEKRLREQRAALEEANNNCRALIVLTDQALAAKYKKMHPGTRLSSSAPLIKEKFFVNAHIEGTEAGQRIALTKEVKA